MADVVTFDPMNLRVIEVNSGLESNQLTWVEIYSEWKDWLLADMTRAGYPPLFRTVGGDPVSDTDALGVAYFWNHEAGWRLRPAEYDHLLGIEGDIFTDPADQFLIAPTLGGYTVQVTFKVSTTIRESRTATATVVQAVEDWGVINFAK